MCYANVDWRRRALLCREVTDAEYWVGNQTMDADTAAAYEQFVAESRARLDSSAQPTAASSHRYNAGWSVQQWLPSCSCVFEHVPKCHFFDNTFAVVCSHHSRCVNAVVNVSIYCSHSKCRLQPWFSLCLWLTYLFIALIHSVDCLPFAAYYFCFCSYSLSLAALIKVNFVLIFCYDFLDIYVFNDCTVCFHVILLTCGQLL